MSLLPQDSHDARSALRFVRAEIHFLKSRIPGGVCRGEGSLPASKTFVLKSRIPGSVCRGEGSLPAFKMFVLKSRIPGGVCRGEGSLPASQNVSFSYRSLPMDSRRSAQTL